MVLLDGYQVVKSKRKNKKYDVLKDNKYITSFGNKNFEHYHDKIGLWSHKDHNDEQRRENFRKRFGPLYEKNKNNKKSAIYYSWNFLW